MTDHNPLVHIVGPKRLQNELLCFLLETKTGLKCTFSSKTDLPPNLEDGSQQGDRLLLWDCLGTDFTGLRSEHGIVLYLSLSQCFIALFNVEIGKGMEREARELKVRGIFYADEPLEKFPEGVKAIVKGELWYPQKFI